MKSLWIALLVSSATVFLTLAGEYQGNVGKLKAVFQLRWMGDSTVEGEYSYPSRPGVVYRLTGENPRDGYLVLREFTGDRHTATCELTKKIASDRIIWEGEMRNTDGRRFPMSFSRMSEMSNAPSEPLGIGPQTQLDLSADVMAKQFGKPGDLEANLYGNLFSGWVVEGRLQEISSVRDLIRQLRATGQPVWSAVRFSGPNIQLQFVMPDGARHVLNGVGNEEGNIRATSKEGTQWRFNKVVHQDAIFLIGGTEELPGQTLVVYRPVDRIYFQFDGEMSRLAPEAFLWNWNVWLEDFHRMRFDNRLREVSGMVEALVPDGEKIAAVRFGIEGERGSRQIDLATPRDRNRVPFEIGFPVTVYLSGDRIEKVGAFLTPVSWRQVGDDNLEFLMVATEQAGFQWDDNLRPHFPPGRFESIDKITVMPNFGFIDYDVFVQWYPEEDMIVWTVGDGSAAMMELESLSLEGVEDTQAAAVKVGPWRSVSEPVDFPTNQLRILNVNTGGGFSGVLPGEN